MNRLRASVRLAALAAWTAALFVVLLGAQLALAPSARLRERARARAFRLWANGVLVLLRARVRVVGVPPHGAYLLAVNHLGYFDTVVLAAHGDVVFVAKSEIAGWPLIGYLGTWMGTVFIDRTRKRDLLRVLPLLERRLRAGHPVAFFPEGTSSPGAEILPLCTPLFEAAVRCGAPTAVATLWYATPPDQPPAELALCWWGDMEFPRHIFALFGLPRFEVTLEFASEMLRDDERKRLAWRVRGVMEKQFRSIPSLPQETCRS